MTQLYIHKKDKHKNNCQQEAEGSLKKGGMRAYIFDYVMYLSPFLRSVQPHDVVSEELLK